MTAIHHALSFGLGKFLVLFVVTTQSYDLFFFRFLFKFIIILFLIISLIRLMIVYYINLYKIICSKILFIIVSLINSKSFSLKTQYSHCYYEFEIKWS